MEDIETTPEGGHHSKLNCRMDLIPPASLLHIGCVLDAGSKKYGEENWRKISRKLHINHAITHLYSYLAGLSIVEGEPLEDHLVHAACRILFAMETPE